MIILANLIKQKEELEEEFAQTCQSEVNAAIAKARNLASIPLK